MVRRRNILSKKRSNRDHGAIQQLSSSSSIISAVKQTPSENLDDETKLAKRHLTKEMWQLVSIAVKRMADELVSISNNQQAVARVVNQESQKTSPFHKPHSTIVENNVIPLQEAMIHNTGAGDVSLIEEKPTGFKELIQRRTIPIQMLQPSLHIKRKGISNNATRRPIKAEVQNKSLKRNRKITPPPRLRNNYKLK